MIQVYTCYPFSELGDKPFTKILPPRPAQIISHDGDKYALVKVEGKLLTVKWCYLSKSKEHAEFLRKDYVTLHWMRENNVEEDEKQYQKVIEKQYQKVIEKQYQKVIEDREQCR